MTTERASPSPKVKARTLSLRSTAAGRGLPVQPAERVPRKAHTVNRRNGVVLPAYVDQLTGQDQEPFELLAVALQAVIEHAVNSALASLPDVVTTEPVMLSIPEAANQLGVGTTKVKQLIASGQLDSITIGRRRLVPAASVRAFAPAADDRR